MQREAVIVAGLVLLALVLMLAARTLYPEIPSIESEIRIERPLNASAGEQPVQTQPTKTPKEPEEEAIETTTETPIQAPQDTQPPGGNATATRTSIVETGQPNTTTPQTTAPREGLELGVSFYNSILSVIHLEENEVSLRGIVREAYEASVEGVCEACVAVILLATGGGDVAVVLVNNWIVENGRERIVDSLTLARELLGASAEVEAIRLNSKVNGVDAYAAIEIEWGSYGAELLEGEHEED
ncbi:MAG: hypothetical protein F7C07_06645 [Desulfurococcales archaeon]|nr:hypothetical protein [Desulfurococcales archaeon]